MFVGPIPATATSSGQHVSVPCNTRIMCNNTMVLHNLQAPLNQHALTHLPITELS